VAHRVTAHRNSRLAGGGRLGYPRVVKADDFRRIALAMPEAVESAHMDHPDFRVGGKVFATLSRDGQKGVVMLTPEQQEALVASAPSVFSPAAGAWGRRGCTEVLLKNARAPVVKKAMTAAWQNKAPAKVRRS
jgi:hypothetical protein